MPTADVEKELLELRGIAEEYRALKNQLLEPPRGWFVLGSHIDQPDVCLEFWGDEGGVPLWERPVPAMDTKYVVTVLVRYRLLWRAPLGHHCGSRRRHPPAACRSARGHTAISSDRGERR